MRDPTTAIDLAERLTDIVFQYLCERDFREMSESINAYFAWSDNYTGPIPLDPLNWRPPARKRGRPSQRRERHLQIAGAVAMLVEDAGLHPTRSHFGRRQRGPSACSIVAAALDQFGECLDERTVEGIWDRYRRSPLINHPTVREWIRMRYPRSNGWAGIWTSEPSKASGIGTADRRR
jgi:hypothetical protein